VSEPLGWGLALGAGLFVSWIAYPANAMARFRPVFFALRVLAVMTVVALLLDLSIGSARAPQALIALDASASWIRNGDSTAWRAAVDSARAGRASMVLFGDSVRGASNSPAPGDLASSVGPVLERAAAAGQPVQIVTDGCSMMGTRCNGRSRARGWWCCQRGRCRTVR